MKNKLHLNQCFSVFYLLLTTIFLFSSCKKLQGEGKTVVEGTTVDKETGVTVPNAQVLLFSSDGKTFGGAYNTVELEEYSDSNGSFSFSFDAEDKNYVLRSFTEQGYYTIWNDAVEIKGGRKNKDLKVKMRSPAWVKITLINKPPLDTLPSLYVSGYNTFENGEQYITFDHIAHDTAFIRPVSGSKTTSIIWRFNRTGEYERFVKEFYFPALDTVEVLIEY